MKLSLYSYLFERDHQYYLYNSETEFLSAIDEDLYEKLYDGAFNEIRKDLISLLMKKKVIVQDNRLYDYYYSAKLRHLSNIGTSDILNLVIAPTSNCNFACPYCFEGEKNNKIMTDKIVKNIISFINGFKTVTKLHLTWYGGEPLIAFNIIEDIVSKINQQCKAKISHQTIITNGYLLSEKVAKRMVKLKFNSVQISLDGDEANHNKTRCLMGSHGKTFSKILHNIGTLIHHTTNDFRIDIRINVNKRNQEDFPILYKKLIKMFGDKRIKPYPGFIRETSKDNCKMCYKSLYSIDRYNFYKEIERQGIPVDFFPHIDIQKGCMVNRNDSFVIGPEGELYKCWNDFNNPERIIGYIHEKKLKNSSLLCHYLYDTSIYNREECKSCLLFPVCDGGCQWFRHKNIFENKEYDTCCFIKDRHILENCLLSKNNHLLGKGPIIKAI